MAKEAATKSKPVQKFRSGAIEVAVWSKTGEKGSFYSVTMSRSYKQGEEWKQSDSFSGDDVIVLAKLLDMDDLDSESANCQIDQASRLSIPAL